MSLWFILALFLCLTTGAGGSGSEVSYQVEDLIEDVETANLLPQKSGNGLSPRTQRQSNPPSNFQNGTVSEDSHLYYNSTFISGVAAEGLWFDLAEMFEDNNSNVTSYRSPLSDESLVLRFLSLPFAFPYYGHLLTFIGVTTNGFLYTGTLIHNRIIDYQYLAPLQSNFNPSLSNDSSVYFYRTADRFTVQWDNVLHADHLEAGPFTFQVSLFPSGEIHFVYKTVPLSVENINSTNHPVRVGLSDAFFIHLFTFRGTLFGFISEYHAVDLSTYNITSNTAIKIHPLPNCIQADSCLECLDVTKNSEFDCGWCPVLNRCSDGIDRHRQEWIRANCHIDADLSFCSENNSQITPSSVPVEPTISDQFTSGRNYPSNIIILPETTQGASISSVEPSTESTESVLPQPGAVSGGRGGSIAGITVGVLVLILIAAAALVVAVIMLALYYGYKHPTSRIGILMTKHHQLSYNMQTVFDAKEERLIKAKDDELD